MHVLGGGDLPRFPALSGRIARGVPGLLDDGWNRVFGGHGE